MIETSDNTTTRTAATTTTTTEEEAVTATSEETTKDNSVITDSTTSGGAMINNNHHNNNNNNNNNQVNNNSSPFDISILSLDILEHISYTYLGPSDAINLSLCNQKFFHALNTNSCWLELCKRDFCLDDMPLNLKHVLLRREMTEDLSPVSDRELYSLIQQVQYPENFPQTKIIYCLLRAQWKFETPYHSDLVVTENGSTIERVYNASRNPGCLCTKPFIIYEQVSQNRTFGWRSYFEVQVKNSAYWLSIGAADESLARYGDYVLGNNEGTAIGYYGAMTNPTFNLNHEILSGCNVRSLQQGDIVGVHVYSIKDESCLIADNVAVATYRNFYIEKHTATKDWKVYAAIYLNGEMICELPLVKDKDALKIYPAVCLGHMVKLKLLMSHSPTRPQDTSSQDSVSTL